MRKTLLLVLLTAGALVVSAGDEPKPYTSWSGKEAEKILRRSPWVEEVIWNRLLDPQANERIEDAGGEQTLIVRVQLFSAHPIRQALAVAAAAGDRRRLDRWREFATRDFPDEIVIAWQVDANPKGCPIFQALQDRLRGMSTAQLSADTFLASSSGRRVYLKEYIPPTPDGTGAKFVFPRHLPDGSPLVGPGDQSFSFQTAPISVVSEYEVRSPRRQCTAIMPASGAQKAVVDSRRLGDNELQVTARFRIRKLVVNDRPDY